jgi:hypothetical protein
MLLRSSFVQALLVLVLAIGCDSSADDEGGPATGEADGGQD